MSEPFLYWHEFLEDLEERIEEYERQLNDLTILYIDAEDIEWDTPPKDKPS